MATAKKTYFHDGTLTISPYHPNQNDKPVKIPRELGQAIDLLYQLENQRKDFQRKADVYDRAAKDLKAILINEVKKQDLNGAAGAVARIKISTERVASLKDFAEFFKYLVKTKNPALIQRRINNEAVREIWESGKEVPGVEPFDVVKLSLTKA